jgi:hypothetical protein
MVSRRSGCLLLALLLCAPRISAAHTALERPFTLVDTNGRTISDKDLRGRWLLVFFGYTSCPDICPTTLSSITTVLKTTRLFCDAGTAGVHHCRPGARYAGGSRHIPGLV